MEQKRTLLAHLTLWQEAARNAQKEKMGRVVFEPKEMERVTGDIRAFIEGYTSSVCAVVERVVETLNGELNYGHLDDTLFQELELCVFSLKGLL